MPDYTNSVTHILYSLSGSLLTLSFLLGAYIALHGWQLAAVLGAQVFQLPTTAGIMSSTIKLHTPMLFDVLDNDPVLVRECGKKWAATGTACRLALALVYLSAGGDNFWGSVYFDTVPTKPPSLVWWNHSYLNQFESPILKDRIEEYKADHRSNFHTIGKHMIRTYPDMWGNLTFDRFLWGALLVETRTFSCPGGPMDASASTWCLVP